MAISPYSEQDLSIDFKIDFIYTRYEYTYIRYESSHFLVF